MTISARIIEAFYATLKSELETPGIHDKQFKILTTAIKNWPAYTVFLVDPRIPIDNNAAERYLRGPALGRNNWYGVHATWSGELAAMMMTFIQTASKHGLNAREYLRYVLDRFAASKGHPRNLFELLPWNIPQQVRQAYGMTSDGGGSP